MPANQNPLRLPNYNLFSDSIAILNLPFSGSELHGIMCGFLCTSKSEKGTDYLRALITNQQDATLREAALALFGVFAVTHQQMLTFDFTFQLLLPDEEESLTTRAQAFSEWCQGFTEGITMTGIKDEDLPEEDTQEALQHIREFSNLDYQNLDIDEEAERSLMEVTEYVRLAVLNMFIEFFRADGPYETTH